MQACDSEPTPQVQGLPVDVRASDNAKNLPYRGLTGALQYHVTATRPDIAYAVRFLSSHNEDYNTRTKHLGIKYDGEAGASRKAFSDADFANNKQDRKSITGSVVTMGGGAVTYMSKKQSLVGQSIDKVEFIAAVETAKNLIWLHELLHEMEVKIDLPIDMFVDNQSAIQVARATATHSRTKHIWLRFHFLKELVDENVVCLQYTGIKDQIADIFTKADDAVLGELANEVVPHIDVLLLVAIPTLSDVEMTALLSQQAAQPSLFLAQLGEHHVLGFTCRYRNDSLTGRLPTHGASTDKEDEAANRSAVWSRCPAGVVVPDQLCHGPER
ncbi:hypothetical protein LEN26_016066 [Aphanomyces euteiches]|nr:hypothetical protein LEN26_016066 [Aphanomyces euteiches]KAH9124702.1 hypothetical protein AeMF1_004577 [Aphanomyces euteiches]KAH9186691.1 hypothetical protein AeNC1_011333 [Aphanomyces euteiches]